MRPGRLHTTCVQKLHLKEVWLDWLHGPARQLGPPLSAALNMTTRAGSGVSGCAKAT